MEALNCLEKPQVKAFIKNGEAMLKNEDVEFRGTAVKEKKKFLGIFKKRLDTKSPALFN